MGVVLTIVAYLIFMVLLPLAGISTLIDVLITRNYRRLNGYFMRIAISLDQLGNVVYSHLFNFLLIKSNAYQFGNEDETISSVLGKNKLNNSLTLIGQFLSKILDRVDNNHVVKSIEK